MNQIKQRSLPSYKFKKFGGKAEHRSSKKSVQTSLLGSSILQLVTNAADVAQEAQQFLSSKRTLQHLRAGRPTPRPLTRRLHSIRAKLDSAFICFQNGTSYMLEDTELADLLESLSSVADELLQVTDSLMTFAKSSRDARLELTRQYLVTIICQAEQAVLRIAQYTNTANSITLPPPRQIVNPKDSSKVLFDMQETTALAPFFEKAQKRGWRVNEKQLVDQDVDVEDGDLEDSFALIKKLSKPIGTLLGNDVLVGITQFPVISLNGNRPSESAIKQCVKDAIDYDFYLILGSYMIIDKMYLMGVHQSIMKVMDERKRTILDTDKFAELHYYLATDQPQWAAILQKTYPVQPAKLEGPHYYCPLVPNALLRSGRHGIGDWAFLTT
jgi:hypothetical protein